MASDNAITRLVAELGFDVDTKGINTFNKELESTELGLTGLAGRAVVAIGALKAFGLAMGALAAPAIAIAAATGAIVAFATATANANFELSKIADDSDVSINALNKFSAAFTLAGESSNSAMSTIQSLAINIRQVGEIGANLNTSFSGALARLGLNLRDDEGELKDAISLYKEIIVLTDGMDAGFARLNLRDLEFSEDLVNFHIRADSSEFEEFLKTAGDRVSNIDDVELGLSKNIVGQLAEVKLTVKELKDDIAAVFNVPVSNFYESINRGLLQLKELTNEYDAELKMIAEGIGNLIGVTFDALHVALSTILATIRGVTRALTPIVNLTADILTPIGGGLQDATSSLAYGAVDAGVAISEGDVTGAFSSVYRAVNDASKSLVLGVRDASTVIPDRLLSSTNETARELLIDQNHLAKIVELADAGKNPNNVLGSTIIVQPSSASSTSSVNNTSNTNNANSTNTTSNTNESSVTNNNHNIITINTLGSEVDSLFDAINRGSIANKVAEFNKQTTVIK